MSASSLSSSPSSHYTSGTVVPSEDSSTFSPVPLLPSVSPYPDSLIDEPTGPRTSSPFPLVHSESLEDHNVGSAPLVSVSPYSSLPPMRLSTPQLLAVNMDDVHTTPTSSPLLLRPSSGRLVGGMKKLLRIPSSGAAGVATSTAHAENPSIALVTQHGGNNHPELELTDRKVFINKVLTHIKRPRNHHFSGLKRRRRMHKHRDRQRSRTHHHYSDDGYTSDPGLLRDVIHEEDVEEEEDTESGDPEVEHRIQRISTIESKLEKYKRLLQEEETILQGFKNEYVQGMEGSMSDKEQHRIKQKFINKQSKAKDTIDQLKKKVEKYEEQLQFIKQGGELEVSPPRYGDKMRSRIKKIGGMRNELKERLRRKKNPTNPQVTIDEDEDEDEDDLEGGVVEEEDDLLLTESHPSFANEDPMLMKDDQHCEYCLGEYQTLAEMLEEQKHEIKDIQKQHTIMLEKLLAERDKSDRLESELNTLMDLHQHGVIELREQLTQMERLTFSKNQDLEDTIENCQTRLHKLEVEINKTDNEKKTPVPSGWIRRVFVPLLTFLLDFLSFIFRISEHIGRRTAFALLIVIIAFVIFYVFFYT